MEILFIIILLVIIVLLFKMSGQLKSIDNEANHIHSRIIENLNQNFTVIGNQIFEIGSSVDAIKWEMQTSEEEKEKFKKEVEKFITKK